MKASLIEIWETDLKKTIFVSIVKVVLKHYGSHGYIAQIKIWIKEGKIIIDTLAFFLWEFVTVWQIIKMRILFWYEQRAVSNTSIGVTL